MALQFDTTYTLTGEDGTTAVLNDPASPDFVGYLDIDNGGVTGLDHADVREATWDIVAGDGAQHGTFYRGRRAITLSCFFPQEEVVSRNFAVDRFLAASEALRADGTLTWTEAGREETEVWWRSQQPTRIVNRLPKRGQAQMVCAQPRILGSLLRSASGTTNVAVANLGNHPSVPTLKIAGASSSPVVTHGATGKKVTVVGSIPSGQTWTINLADGSVADNLGIAHDGSIDPLNTDWGMVALPGSNAFSLAGGGTLTVEWRSTWK